MTEPEISDEQLKVIEEKLGINVSGMEKVANDTKNYFLERSQEEDLDLEEMVSAIDSVHNHIKQGIIDGLGEIGE